MKPDIVNLEPYNVFVNALLDVGFQLINKSFPRATVTYLITPLGEDFYIYDGYNVNALRIQELAKNWLTPEDYHIAKTEYYRYLFQPDLNTVSMVR